MFIFVLSTVIEDSGVEDRILLHISLSKSFVFAFFKVEKLILHINAFLVLDDNDLVIRVVSFILETAQLFHVDLFGAIFLVDLHSVNFQLFSIFEGYKFLLKAVFIVADVMRYFEVDFKFVVVFIIPVFFLFSADIADVVFEVDVHSKLILVEEISRAEFAVGVHESNISELVDVSLLQVPIQGFEGV